MKIAITGGVSAGHVVPAVAGRLRGHGADLVFLGRENTIELELAQRAGIPFRDVPSAGVQRHRSAANLLMPFTVTRGILAAYRALGREGPDALISKGDTSRCPSGSALPSLATRSTTHAPTPPSTRSVAGSSPTSS